MVRKDTFARIHELLRERPDLEPILGKLAKTRMRSCCRGKGNYATTIHKIIRKRPDLRDVLLPLLNG